MEVRKRYHLRKQAIYGQFYAIKEGKKNNKGMKIYELQLKAFL